MIKILVLGLAVVASSATAQSENLVKVYAQPNGDATFVDTSTIQAFGTSKRYWEVTKMATPNQYRVVLQRTFLEIDCNARMRAQRAYVDYDAQGQVVASDASLDRPAQWRPIVPGSNGELVRLIVCSR